MFIAVFTTACHLSLFRTRPPTTCSCQHAVCLLTCFKLKFKVLQSQARPQLAVQEDGLQTRRVPGNVSNRQLRTVDKGRLYRYVARPRTRNSSRQESELSTQHTSLCCRPEPPPSGPPRPLRVLHSGGRSTILVSSLRIGGT